MLMIIENIDMAAFAALAKIYSIKYFCNTKVPRLGENFVQRKFLYVTVPGKTRHVAKILKIAIAHLHDSITHDLAAA